MSAWSNQLFGLQNLKTTIFYGRFYIDIPLSILNIIPVNVHLFRKGKNSQNRKRYRHRNIVMTCRKSKFGNITLLVFSCMFEYPQMFFNISRLLPQQCLEK